MADFMFIDAFQAFLQELSPQEKLQVGEMLQTQLEVEVKREEEALMSRRRVLHHLQCSICQGLWDTLFAGREAPWHGDEPTDSEWVADGDARVAVNIYALKRAHRTATKNWQWAAMMINNNKIVPPPPGSETATAAAPEQRSKGKAAERPQVEDQGSFSAVPLAIQQRVDAARPEAAVPGQKGPGVAKAEAAADVLGDRQGKAAERPMAQNQGSSRANPPKSFDHPTPMLEGLAGNQKAQGGYLQGQIWSAGDVTIPPPATVRESDTSQHPHAPLVGAAGGAARSTNIAAANANLGPWKDEHGRDLPRFADAGPGEIILPPNIDPLSHIVPVRAKVEELLNVALWYVVRNPFVKHNKIGIKPIRGAMSEEGQTSYCRRAFLVLTRWTLQVGETGAVTPLLDFVKADTRDEIERVTGMISALLAPAPEGHISTRNPNALVLSSQNPTKRVAEAPRDVTALQFREGATSGRPLPASGSASVLASASTPASTVAVASVPYATPNKRRREGSDPEDEPRLGSNIEALSLGVWRRCFNNVEHVIQRTIPGGDYPEQDVFCLLLTCMSVGWYSAHNLDIQLDDAGSYRKWLCVLSVCRDNRPREVGRDGICAHCQRNKNPNCLQMQNVGSKRTILRIISIK
ncbi:hypothetical protein Hte_012565 [Hypoxylon texense]